MVGEIGTASCEAIEQTVGRGLARDLSPAQLRLSLLPQGMFDQIDHYYDRLSFLGPYLTPIAETVEPYLQKVWEVVRPLTKLLSRSLNGVWRAVVPWLRNTVLPVLAAAWETVKPFVR